MKKIERTSAFDKPSKKGSLKNIIKEIPIQASAFENVYLLYFQMHSHYILKGTQ